MRAKWVATKLVTIDHLGKRTSKTLGWSLKTGHFELQITNLHRKHPGKWVSGLSSILGCSNYDDVCPLDATNLAGAKEEAVRALVSQLEEILYDIR